MNKEEIPQFKHVRIAEHPLKNEYMVVNVTFPQIPPYFGTLNILNPYFDKDIFWARKGGSCFYQGKDYTYEQLYNICYECCEMGVAHYISKYKE